MSLDKALAELKKVVNSPEFEGKNAAITIYVDPDTKDDPDNNDKPTDTNDKPETGTQSRPGSQKKGTKAERKKKADALLEMGIKAVTDKVVEPEEVRAIAQSLGHEKVHDIEFISDLEAWESKFNELLAGKGDAGWDDGEGDFGL